MLDLIRGKDINRALSALQFSNKSVARDVAKVLRSAVANAQQKEGFGGDVERLFVSKCHADNGPSMKRVRPAPMGRAFRVVKRTTHLTVEVTERPQVIKAVGHAKATAAQAEARRRRPPKRQGGEEDGRQARREDEQTIGSGAGVAGPIEGDICGPESPPVRVPARVQQDLEVALVRRQGLRVAAARGSRAQARPQEAVSACRRRQGRDRARRQQAEDRHPHLAPGHHHRPQGTGSRQAEAGDPEADQPRGLHQHPGDPEARARCAADWRIGGDAARKARGVPPRDAQGGRVGAALRRARHQGAGVGAA